MVEELDNIFIDNTLNDIKSENETETTIKKPSKNTKKELQSKVETKAPKSRTKSKKPKRTTGTKEEARTEEDEEEKSEAKDSLEFVSLREEKFVEYDEADYTLREISIQDKQILIGPKRLTRFEKARITGARSLQISFGAPLMIKADVKSRSSISLAIEELEKKALPISIRRVLPNGLYQDVPIEWLKT